MRRKLPVFWVLQLLFLTGLGAMSFFAPMRLVELSRGKRAPQKVDRPDSALYEWVLRLRQVPPPSAAVRSFFRSDREIPAGQRRIWTPNDSSIQRFTQKDDPDEFGTAETENAAWTAVENWLLSCEPSPPQEIREWVHAIDEFPEPSQELRDWIVAQQDPQPPPMELRLLILHADQTLPVSWRLAASQVRLSAACVLGAALFTLFGLLSPSIRRPLARSFVLVILFLTVSLLLSSLRPQHWNLTYAVLIGGLILGVAMVATAVHAVPGVSTGRVLWAVLAVWWISIIVQASINPTETGSAVGQMSIVAATSLLAVLGIVNAHYWLIGKREDPPQDDAGIAQRRPPQLWTLWMVQFVVLLAVGGFTLVFPDWTARMFTTDRIDYLDTDIVNDSVRMLGAWMIALALFSFFALGAAPDWIWQGIGWIFCLVFACMAVSTFVNGHAGGYSIWGYLYGFQGLVFVPITVMLLRKKDPWSAENVERTRWHWSLTDVAAALPLLWGPLWQGRRAFYRHGVGARGRLRVLPRPVLESDGVPESAFFVPEREFPVEARFANRTQEDDAALDVRGCALRLSAERTSPLDLLFATGAFASARNLLDFRLLLPHRNLRRGVLKHKVLREGLAAGMRRAPASFAGLSYYHPLVLEWLTPGAGHYLVRFRLVPQTAEAETEQGLPDAEDLQHLWLQPRRDGETRDPDYLRQGLRERLAGGQTVTFRLEAQFHRPHRDDSLDWYDPSLEWNERTHAWHPLAELVLDRPLSAEESEGLRFDPGILPPTLRVPMPESETDIYDPRSLAAAQYRIVGALGRVRTWRRPAPASLHSGAAARANAVESGRPVAVR